MFGSSKRITELENLNQNLQAELEKKELELESLRLAHQKVNSKPPRIQAI